MSTLRSTFAAPLLVLLLGTLLPHAAHACAVCTSGTNGGTKKAFIVGSLFLSTLPFFTIGTLIYYVRRRAKQEAAREEARVAARTPSRAAVRESAEPARA